MRRRAGVSGGVHDVACGNSRDGEGAGAIQQLVAAIGQNAGGHGRKLQPVQIESAGQNVEVQHLLSWREKNGVGNRRPGLRAAGGGHGPSAG